MLSEKFDFVLVDCPAGVEDGFKNALAACKEAIVVTNPELSAVRDADRVIGILNTCLLYTSPSPRDYGTSRMPSSA